MLIKEEITDIVHCLLTGGIVLLPTDTVYGLAVSPNFDESVEKLYTIKNRPKKLPLPIMLASSTDLEPLGLEVNDSAHRILNSEYVPGAVTLVLGFKKQALVTWLKDRQEVGVRIPNDERLLAILDKTGPLLVTSANRHGVSIIPQNTKEVLEQLNGIPDKIIAGGNVKDIPSTIINCRFHPPIIERNGGISEEALKKCLDIK